MIQSPEKIIASSDDLCRIDKFLHSKFPDYSRTFFQELIETGKVMLNNKHVTKKTAVCINDEIEIVWPSKTPSLIPQPEKFNFDILFEDEDMLVINKPAGMVVHPAAGNWSGTVVNALLGKDENFLEKLNAEDSDEISFNRPGIVHRIDKDTSGCLVIAKNIISKNRISESFADRKVKKIYKTIVIGKPQKQKDRIETLIGRHHIHRQKMAVVNHNGKEAITIYDLVRVFEYERETLSLLDVQILTGRTHQIRVHLAYKKLPILGDSLYGGKQKVEAPRQMLHAWKIELPHPRTKEILTIECPLPDDFSKYFNFEEKCYRN